jgi:hypothetical protein
MSGTTGRNRLTVGRDLRPVGPNRATVGGNRRHICRKPSSGWRRPSLGRRLPRAHLPGTELRSGGDEPRYEAMTGTFAGRRASVPGRDARHRLPPWSSFLRTHPRHLPVVRRIRPNPARNARALPATGADRARRARHRHRSPPECPPALARPRALARKPDRSRAQPGPGIPDARYGGHVYGHGHADGSRRRS